MDIDKGERKSGKFRIAKGSRFQWKPIQTVSLSDPASEKHPVYSALPFSLWHCNHNLESVDSLRSVVAKVFSEFFRSQLKPGNPERKFIE